MKRLFRVFSGVAALLTAAVICASCSSFGAPSIDEIGGELTALIEASYEINDIFFGEGLPVYDREEASGDGNASYDEKSGTYYWIIDDEKIGTVIKTYGSDKEYRYLTENADAAASGAEKTEWTAEDGTSHTFYEIKYTEEKKEYVYDEDSPVHYDYILIDCPYQTVQSIKDAAGKVYSEAYLNAIYGVIFDGFATDNEIVYARYMEDDTLESDFFMKSNLFEPYFTEQTKYDYSTMKIVNPSRPDFINVEIEADGRYIDYESLEVTTGKHTVTLKFVKENGGWRLDTPTY